MPEGQAHPVLSPESREQFDQCFPSEQACQEYVRRIRWPAGFRCPGCGCAHGWITRHGLTRCTNCQHQWSVTSGTAFEGTRKPLRDWLRAIWIVAGSKSGVSALGLKRELNLHSYQTAWVWMHRVRQLMVGTAVRLSGTVEAGQATFAAQPDGALDAGQKTEPIVAIAVAVEGPTGGSISLRKISNPSGEWDSFLRDAIAPEATVRARSDVILAGAPLKYHEASRVVYVASALDRWLRRTYCGAVDPAYLAYYLDEFTFRVNHRRSASRAELFHILLSEAIHRPPERHLRVAARKVARSPWQIEAPPVARLEGGQTVTGGVSPAQDGGLDVPVTA